MKREKKNTGSEHKIDKIHEITFLDFSNQKIYSTSHMPNNDISEQLNSSLIEQCGGYACK